MVFLATSAGLCYKNEFSSVYRYKNMFAIISDIHSNLEALTTVLADIESRSIETIYCLGDIVGYAANPKECLDLVIEKTEFAILGNHDYAVLYEPTNFNFGAEAAAYWTREMLELEEQSQLSNKRWRYLGAQQMRRTLELAAKAYQRICFSG